MMSQKSTLIHTLMHIFCLYLNIKTVKLGLVKQMLPCKEYWSLDTKINQGFCNDINDITLIHDLMFCLNY